MDRAGQGRGLPTLRLYRAERQAHESLPAVSDGRAELTIDFYPPRPATKVSELGGQRCFEIADLTGTHPGMRLHKCGVSVMLVSHGIRAMRRVHAHRRDWMPEADAVGVWGRLSPAGDDGPDGGMPRRSRFFQAFGLRQLPDSGEGRATPKFMVPCRRWTSSRSRMRPMSLATALRAPVGYHLPARWRSRAGCGGCVARRWNLSCLHPPFPAEGFDPALSPGRPILEA